MTLERRYTPALGRSILLRDNNSDDGMWEEAFGRGLHLPPPEMPDPALVLDLGANIGLTAVSYANLWPGAQVWMVEPNAENMELARKNARICIPIQMAVAKDSGYRYLREEGLTASSYTLGEDGREVYAIGIDHLIEFLGGEIDFCKMDVEGAEWEILERPLTGIKHLLVEFHGEQPYDVLLKRGLDLLRSMGWDARHHPPHPAAAFATR